MRMTVMVISVFAAAMAASTPARADDAAAIEAAKAWYARVVAGQKSAEPLPATPLSVTVRTEKVVRPCNRFASAKLTSAKQLARFAACMVAIDHRVQYRTRYTPRWGIEPGTVAITNELNTGRSPKQHQRFVQQVAADAKDATLVRMELTEGQVGQMRMYLAVTTDGTVKAVWLSEWLFVMETDSPSLSR
jgi:hypothetical protein